MGSDAWVPNGLLQAGRRTIAGGMVSSPRQSREAVGGSPAAFMSRRGVKLMAAAQSSDPPAAKPGGSYDVDVAVIGGGPAGSVMVRESGREEGGGQSVRLSPCLTRVDVEQMFSVRCARCDARRRCWPRSMA